MSDYKKFQEWLDVCPVKMLEYDDFTDQFRIVLEVPLEDDDEHQ
jgi:hypothetical protein